MGYVSSVESMTAVDGEGIRSMIFLHGCPLRCVMCANPEMSFCTKKPESVSTTSILEDIARFKSYIRGISISGGEPLHQPEFTAELMKGAHELNLTTCLDTSGAGTRHSFDTVLKHTDYALFCVKSLDPDMYAKITGRSQHRAMEFARELDIHKIPYNLRYVVIPGMTDRPKDIEQLIRFSKAQPTLQQVEILPYHKLGLGKWSDLHLKCPIEHTDTPSHDSIMDIVKDIRDSNIKVLW